MDRASALSDNPDSTGILPESCATRQPGQPGYPRPAGEGGEAAEPTAQDGAPGLTRGVLLFMAAAAGLFVASIYYNQPMLGILAREFGVGAAGVSSVATATQVGYAAGLLLLASLGDSFERRRLICLTALGLSGALAAAALAPGLAALTAASLCVGLLATVAQQVVPMAAHLAPEAQRGRVVGTVMAGILSGILLARTVSGLVSEHGGWRGMFWLASAATLLMSGVLALRLPRVEPTAPISYPRMLLSLVRLWRNHAALRRSGLVQGLLFAAFVAFWAELALFLEQPPFRAGSSTAGLLGLLGVAGVLAAPLAGRLADRGSRGRSRAIVRGAGAVALSFVLFGLWRTSWGVLFGGIVLLDIGIQTAMISNQSRVYGLDASARSRLNTVFMTVMFACGALGSALGGQAFALFGWKGVCVLGGSCGALAHRAGRGFRPPCGMAGPLNVARRAQQLRAARSRRVQAAPAAPRPSSSREAGSGAATGAS